MTVSHPNALITAFLAGRLTGIAQGRMSRSPGKRNNDFPLMLMQNSKAMLDTLCEAHGVDNIFAHENTVEAAQQLNITLNKEV